MPDPIPKPSAQRRRRNLTVGPVKLRAGVRPTELPLLVGDGLSDWAIDYWALLWNSPMAVVWLAEDVPALTRLAQLQDKAIQGFSSAAELSEIRQLEDRFGLSPLARRRLQWELQQAGGEEGEETASGQDDRWLRAV